MTRLFRFQKWLVAAGSVFPFSFNTPRKSGGPVEKRGVMPDLSPRQASVFIRITLIPAGLTSVVASSLITLSMQSLLPKGPGLSYLLFSYKGELIAVSVIGAIVPLVLSAVGTVIVLLVRDRSDPGRKLGLQFWLSVVLLAILSAIVVTLSNALYGGLALPKSWALASAFVGASGGVGFALRRKESGGTVSGAVECYALGTFGMFLGDLIRTFGGLAYVPGAALVWGGGGLLDFVFWFGIYLALGFFLFSVLRRALLGLARPKNASSAGPQGQGSPF